MILVDKPPYFIFKTFQFLILLFFLSCSSEEAPFKKEILIEGPTMGTTYKIVLKTSQDIDENFNLEIDSILNVVNQSMSTYIDESEISSFNKMKKNIQVPISDHFYHVMEKSFYYHDISDGMFDVTIGPLYELWGFQGREIINEPSRRKINKTLNFVGMNQLTLTSYPKTLSKKNKNTTIDLNAIAKGYAVDLLSDYLKKEGYLEHFVEIGGEIKIQSNTDDYWGVGIQNPDQIGESIEEIYLLNKSIATSGNYFNYIEYLDTQSIKTHIINPLTGYPLEVKEGMISSASVIANNCIDADALATTLMLLDIDDGIELIESLDDVEAYIIYFKDDMAHYIESSGLKDYKK